MERYFSERSYLFNAFSEFCCPDDCERMGCKHPELHISISIIDLVSISLVTDQKISDLFEKNIKIGFDPINENEPFIGRITFELKKPCNFLDEKKCSVYPGRPIACALFPEALFISENIETYRSKEFFKDFPCVQVPFPISPKRKEALYKLFDISLKEAFFSDFYIFGISPFILDLKNISDLVLKGISPLKDGRFKIINQHIEGLLFQKFLEGGYLSQWKEKLERLDKDDRLIYLEELKNRTDSMLEWIKKESFSIKYQFNGSKIREIHM